MENYIIIPILIFCARIIDVSLGTVRIIFISKGYRNIAPFIGFIEILIWIMAISEIMQNLNNWLCYIAYAGGFAAGNYIGMLIEEKLAIGFEMVRVITKKNAYELIENLRNGGYGITSINAQGIEGEVSIIYIIVNRKKIDEVINIIKNYNPNALYTIEDIRFVNKEIYHKITVERQKFRLFGNRKI